MFNQSSPQVLSAVSDVLGMAMSSPQPVTASLLLQLFLLVLGSSGIGLIWWWWEHPVPGVMVSSTMIGTFLLGLSVWGMVLSRVETRYTSR